MNKLIVLVIVAVVGTTAAYYSYFKQADVKVANVYGDVDDVGSSENTQKTVQAVGNEKGAKLEVKMLDGECQRKLVNYDAGMTVIADTQKDNQISDIGLKTLGSGNINVK